VSDPSPLLDRAGIEDAFRRLGERLARRGVVADLYVFGGAAMALAYDSRRATRDVDALFKPHGIVHEEALAVAAELGLPRWWLNEQASSYVAPGGDPAASRVFDHPGLRVFASLAGAPARDERFGFGAGAVFPGRSSADGGIEEFPEFSDTARSRRASGTPCLPQHQVPVVPLLAAPAVAGGRTRDPASADFRCRHHRRAGILPPCRTRRTRRSPTSRRWRAPGRATRHGA